MKKKIEVRTYTPFCVPIIVTHLTDKFTVSSLQKYAKKIRKTESRKISNIGGFQSDFLPHEEDPLLNFFNHIQVILKSFVTIHGLKDNCAVTPDGVWMNINKQNDFNRQHSHDGGADSCDFCGIYYIQANDKQGSVQFINPNNYTRVVPMLNKKAQVQSNHFNKHTFDITPHTGRLILFPNNVEHMVFPNPTKKDRISLAFNLKVSWY